MDLAKLKPIEESVKGKAKIDPIIKNVGDRSSVERTLVKDQIFGNKPKSDSGITQEDDRTFSGVENRDMYYAQHDQFLAERGSQEDERLLPERKSQESDRMLPVIKSEDHLLPGHHPDRGLLTDRYSRSQVDEYYRPRMLGN